MTGNPLDPIIHFATEIIAPPKPSKLIVREIDKDEVEALKTATNLVLKKYKHSIDPDGVRHLYKKHSVNPRIDEIPLTAGDLYLIPSILEKPDFIERSDHATGRGNMAIKYTKTIGDEVFTYIAEVVFKDKVIQTKTMYKNRLP